MNRAALNLFPSTEAALEFLEEYDLDEARCKLLVDMGKVLKAAGIHVKNGNMLKAVETLITSAHVDHVRPAIGYLFTGLWRGSALGALPASNPTILKLLRLGHRLDKSAMTEQEVDEVCIFRPLDQ